MKTRYLFYGFGSEYVLHQLYERMCLDGISCIELDASVTPITRQFIDELATYNIVLITSAHITLDQRSFYDIYMLDQLYLSPLELMALLKPIRSVYIPHDLSCPLVEDEEDYLQLFDYFLSPLPVDKLSFRGSNIEPCGWIKWMQSFDDSLENSKNAIWFFSDIGYHHMKYGVHGTYNKIRPLLEQGVAIKFPQWPGIDAYEEYFRTQGIEVVPSTENTLSLIHEYRCIITNSESSVVAEAYYYGKLTLNVLEQYKGNIQQQMFKGLEGLVFIDDIRTFRLDKIESSRTQERVMQPFDYQKACSLIRVYEQE